MSASPSFRWCEAPGRQGCAAGSAGALRPRFIGTPACAAGPLHRFVAGDQPPSAGIASCSPNFVRPNCSAHRRTRRPHMPIEVFCRKQKRLHDAVSSKPRRAWGAEGLFRGFDRRACQTERIVQRIADYTGASGAAHSPKELILRGKPHTSSTTLELLPRLEPQSGAKKAKPGRGVAGFRLHLIPAGIPARQRLLAGRLRGGGSTRDAGRLRGAGSAGHPGSSGRAGEPRRGGRLGAAVRALVEGGVYFGSAFGAFHGAGFHARWSEAHTGGSFLWFPVRRPKGSRVLRRRRGQSPCAPPGRQAQRPHGEPWQDRCGKSRSLQATLPRPSVRAHPL